MNKCRKEAAICRRLSDFVKAVIFSTIAIENVILKIYEANWLIPVIAYIIILFVCH